MTIFLGILLGLAVGAGCRWGDIPVPSPPSLPGALLVLAMTTGFLGADYVLSPSQPHAAQNEPVQPTQISSAKGGTP